MTSTQQNAPRSRGWAGWTTWLAGLLVALGAGVATAHGLYEVAAAAGTPEPIAWLYPLITDGLALVAYASTARLTGSGRRYAWTVVVLAAGLSGLAQATYLAGGVATAPTALRFGVGAWPALAAAVVAHLLYLIGEARNGTTERDRPPVDGPATIVQSRVPMNDPASVPNSVHTTVPTPVPTTVPSAVPMPELPSVPTDDNPTRDTAARETETGGSARTRALDVASEHHQRTGALPTARELSRVAAVGRGTAARALQELRQPIPLHLVTPSTAQSETSSPA